MNWMKSYTVHAPIAETGDTKDRADRLEFVKEGFALLAFLFPILWSLYHRLWYVLLGFVAAMVLVQILLFLTGAGDEATGLAAILLQLLFGFEANTLRRWNLEQKGYQIIGAVNGHSLEECELKFFESWARNEQAATSLSAIAARKSASELSGLGLSRKPV